jgi:hypothetical protein
MAHTGDARRESWNTAGALSYEVVLGPAALRIIRALPFKSRGKLGYALGTELIDGPNADKEIKFDADLHVDSDLLSSVAYQATPISYGGYTVVHRPMTDVELKRLSSEQDRSVADNGVYVIDILAPESAFSRGSRL